MTPQVLFNRYKTDVSMNLGVEFKIRRSFCAGRVIFVFFINHRQLEYFFLSYALAYLFHENNHPVAPKIFMPIIVRFKNGKLS